jgi:hypothetical protein
MQTSQGYIFCILQHFVTKFCNFTDFNKFFTGIYFFLPKSKISLTCKLSIVCTKLVHLEVKTKNSERRSLIFLLSKVRVNSSVHQSESLSWLFSDLSGGKWCLQRKYMCRQHETLDRRKLHNQTHVTEVVQDMYDNWMVSFCKVFGQGWVFIFLLIFEVG